MYKPIMLIAIFLFSLSSMHAQTAYFDAVKLRSYIEIEHKTIRLPGGITKDTMSVKFSSKDSDGDGLEDHINALKILSRYSNPANVSKIATIDEIKNHHGQNPFVKGYISGSPNSSEAIGNIGSALSAIGNMDVTAFADGVAQFLVERAKEELNVAFFERFNKFLNQYPEFKIIFPNTRLFIENLNAWEYANALNTLREAFDKDIKTILVNIINLRNLDAVMDCPKEGAGETIAAGDSTDCQRRAAALRRAFATNAGHVIFSGLYIGHGLTDGQKIPDIIDTVANGKSFIGGYNNDNVQNAMNLVSVMTSSLRSYEEGRHFITSSQMRELQRDTILLNLYLGLIYEQIRAKEIRFVRDGKTYIVANIIQRDGAGLKQYVMNVADQVKLIDTAVTTLQQRMAAGEKDLSANYAAVYGYAKAVLSAAGRTELINAFLVLPPQYTEVLGFSTKSLQIAHDITVRNYNAVVIGVMSLMSDIIAKMPEGDDKENAKEFIAAFLKYGSFAANVVNAKSAADVKDAIQAVAMPSGSSRVKRMSAFNVALNAYVGPFIGYERSSALDENTEPNSYGITAPIGVAISKGYACWLNGKHISSWSLFVSVIDLGAVTAFRFSDSETEEIPTIQLKNILAPGAFVVYGFGNTPLSLMLGAQVGPSLRKVSATSNTVADNMYYRFIASLAVDIPMFNFYTAPKRLFVKKHK